MCFGEAVADKTVSAHAAGGGGGEGSAHDTHRMFTLCCLTRTDDRYALALLEVFNNSKDRWVWPAAGIIHG